MSLTFGRVKFNSKEGELEFTLEEESEFEKFKTKTADFFEKTFSYLWEGIKHPFTHPFEKRSQFSERLSIVTQGPTGVTNIEGWGFSVLSCAVKGGELIDGPIGKACSQVAPGLPIVSAVLNTVGVVRSIGDYNKFAADPEFADL